MLEQLNRVLFEGIQPVGQLGGDVAAEEVAFGLEGFDVAGFRSVFHGRVSEFTKGVRLARLTIITMFGNNVKYSTVARRLKQLDSNRATPEDLTTGANLLE